MRPTGQPRGRPTERGLTKHPEFHRVGYATKDPTSTPRARGPRGGFAEEECGSTVRCAKHGACRHTQPYHHSHAHCVRAAASSTTGPQPTREPRLDRGAEETMSEGTPQPLGTSNRHENGPPRGFGPFECMNIRWSTRTPQWAVASKGLGTGVTGSRQVAQSQQDHTEKKPNPRDFPKSCLTRPGKGNTPRIRSFRMHEH